MQAWLIAVKSRPQCRFWFYTRSFIGTELLAVLPELGNRPNCQGFLSIDSENFKRGLLAFAQYPGIWKLALMQQEEEQLSPDLFPAIRKQVSSGQIISFPYHRGGRHVSPLRADPLTVCPQITTKAYPLQPARSLIKPCQACSLCLPG